MEKKKNDNWNRCSELATKILFSTEGTVPDFLYDLDLVWKEGKDLNDLIDTVEKAYEESSGKVECEHFLLTSHLTELFEIDDSKRERREEHTRKRKSRLAAFDFFMNALIIFLFIGFAIKFFI